MANYREDIIDIDLGKGSIHRSFLPYSIGEGDELADRFGIRAFRDGEPVTLTGTCMGLFVRADGETVALDNGVISGNTAYVTLKKSCYVIEGPFTLAIKATETNNAMTLRIVDGKVSRTSTSEIVDPGTILPSIETLIAEIEAAIASVPADYSSLWNSVAPVFSSSKSYVPGNIVAYNGVVYVCTSAHSGSWNASHFLATNLGDNISEIKSSLLADERVINTGNYKITKKDLESGLWNVSTKQADATRGRTSYLIPVKAGMCIEYHNTTFDTFFGVMESATSTEYIQTIGWKTDGNGTILITKDGLLSFVIRNHADTTATVNVNDYNSNVMISTELFGKVLRYVSHGTAFSLNDLPNNSYTNFVYPSDTFSEAPADIVNGGYAIYRLSASQERSDYYLHDLETLLLISLSNPTIVYIGSYAASRTPPFSGWRKLPDINDVSVYISHNTTFSITDIPVNRYTTFVVPTDTFTDSPLNLKPGGYAIYRTQSYSNNTISIIWLYGLTNANDIWFATYNSGRTPALSSWYKIPAGIDAATVQDALITGNYQIEADRIKQGWWNWGSPADSSNRIRYDTLLKVGKYAVVNYNVSSTFDIYLGVAPYPGATEWSEFLYWEQGNGQNNKYFINHDGYLGIILRKHDGSDITPDEYNSIISVDSSPSCPKLDRLTCKIFRKVVCCGDSYTAGYIRTDEPAGTPSVMTHEDYAWPHYMETLTGNKWENCGSSGATTVTWQTVERGLPKAQSIGKAQAYVIGLMINDVGDTYHVDIGTAADIGTNANTYYAQLSKIIRELHEINDDAIVFVNTCPRSDPDFAPYNKAVRDIVSAYKTTYHAHCIDLYNYKHLYDNASLTGDSLNGHFSAIGYEQFAEIYAYILSDYINSHISDFQSVHKIPYDE